MRSGAEQLTSPQHEVKPAASLRRSVLARTRRSRALPLWAKAMDGTRELGAGAKGPPGAGGVEWSEGCPWNWRDPSRRRASKHTSRQPVVPGSIDTDNQRTWETVKCRAEVGGGRSSDDDRDNITRSERRASSQVCEATSDDRGIAVGLSTHPPLAVPSRDCERRLGHPPTPLAGRNAADRLPGGEPCAGEPHARFGKGGLGRVMPRRDGPHAPEGKPPGLSPSTAPATPNQFPTSPSTT